MRLLCPAKINLHLRVGPARADGFHPLLSWMCTVGFFDTLTLTPVQDAGSAGRPIDLVCDSPDLPCDERNLIVRIAATWGSQCASSSITEAARDVAAAEQGSSRIGGAQGGTAHLPPPFSLRAELQKRIPVGAGLGGGSSDGARTLLALNRLSRAGRTVDDLSAFAARFGSDLSFFLYGPSSICTGRGEVVRPIARPAPRWALLVLPPIFMSTADVYRRFDAMGLGRESDVSHEPDWSQWTTLAARDLLPRLINDLEAPAFALRPDLDELRRSIERDLGRFVRMSGSGSSLFSLFDHEDEAAAAASLVRERSGVRSEHVELAPTLPDDLDHSAASPPCISQ